MVSQSVKIGPACSRGRFELWGTLQWEKKKLEDDECQEVSLPCVIGMTVVKLSSVTN